MIVERTLLDVQMETSELYYKLAERVLAGEPFTKEEIARHLTNAADAFRGFYAQFNKPNTPIDELVKQYAAEHGLPETPEVAAAMAHRYVKTMEDSQVRVLLYLFAKWVTTTIGEDTKKT